MTFHRWIAIALTALSISSAPLAFQSSRFRSATLAQEPKLPPLTPAESIKSMQLASDLQIELVAAEPLVQDPVALCWDAHGALYVAEMGDYPALPTGGRIKRLLDTDGDGQMDRATTFADSLPFPTSVLPYRDGILVTAAPDLWFLRDQNGDGVAETRQKLLTGFGEGNQQLRANGLIWGIDNWIYGANGRSDGDLRFMSEKGTQETTPISIRSRDFRFQPDLRRVEPAGGFTQFGQSFDDFGRRFISWNTVHIRQVVMEQHYLTRNPQAPLTATAQEISNAGSTPRLFPISQTTQRFNAEAPGFFNASCGLTIFRGDALGGDYEGNAFACEPLSNLVHRDVLTALGSSMIAGRAPKEVDREFLASTDSWFRPVNLAAGPDGALYIVDFYRKWVEHPQWVANEEARKTLDWSEGKEFGRIYRVVTKSPQTAQSHRRDLASLDSKKLVKELESPNAWQRETAQRLLVERKDLSVVTSVSKLSLSSPDDRAKIHALGVLAGMGKLDDRLLSQILAAGSSRVQRVACQFCEPFLAGSEPLTRQIADLSSTSDPALRYQVVCSLSYAPTTPAVLSALGTVFEKGGSDDWVRQALFLAVAGRVQPFMAQLQQSPSLPAKLSIEQIRWLIQVTASERDKLATPSIGEPLTREFWSMIVSLASGKVASPVSAENLKANIDDPQLAPNVRLLSIGMLRFAPPADAIPVLKTLLSADQPLDLQQWASETSFAISDPLAASMLLEATRSMTSAVQRTAIDHLISRREYAKLLFAAIEQETLHASELDAAQQNLLLSQLDGPQQARAKSLLVSSSRESKDELISRYAASLMATHSPGKGRELFQKHCRTCHMRQGEGAKVGPDLTGVAGRSPTDILADILDPDRSISVDGRSYILLSKSGVVSTGIIAGETASSITLKKPGGEIETVLRSDIEELRFSGKSLMPEGFEQHLSPEDLASLISYLKSAETK